MSHAPKAHGPTDGVGRAARPTAPSDDDAGTPANTRTQAWEVRLERIRIQLAVGVHADELRCQPVEIDLTLYGHASAAPQALSDCIDYAPLLHWIRCAWPRTPHTPLLETRLSELVEACFRLDPRVDHVTASLFKTRLAEPPGRVGMTLRLSRAAFAAGAAPPLDADGA